MLLFTEGKKNRPGMERGDHFTHSYLKPVISVVVPFFFFFRNKVFENKGNTPACLPRPYC